MSNPRHAVKRQHERFHVQLLVNALNLRHRAQFRVVAEPEPPEAIIQSGSTTRWIEVVSAFWSDAYARDLYSYATREEEYQPIADGLYVNMTPEFAKRFVKAVRGKLEKSNYGVLRDRYGPGYLVVPVLFPFFGPDTLTHMRSEWQKAPVNDQGCFRSVYLTYPSLGAYAVLRWQPRAVG